MKSLRLPAEWEPHAATWLAWPRHRTDWPGKLATVRWAFAELVRLLSQIEPVRLLVESPDEQRKAARILEHAGADVDQVDFFPVRTDRAWARDYLPMFAESGGRRVAVKWRFNGWGRYADHRRDDAAGLWVARRQSSTVWLPRVGRRRLALEGGAIDVDGRGTLLATEECLLSGPRARLAALGRDRVEALFSDFLGVRQVIWLPSGIAGDDTSGHVDDFARFVARGHVVVCREPNRRDPNHAPLEAARRALGRARDAHGRPLELTELPMPRPVTFDGQRLPASYANFYIANRRVLVPTFNDPADGDALRILSEVFKRREVIGVYARDWILGLGSLHCSTMQEPRLARALR